MFLGWGCDRRNWHEVEIHLPFNLDHLPPLVVTNRHALCSSVIHTCACTHMHTHTHTHTHTHIHTHTPLPPPTHTHTNIHTHTHTHFSPCFSAKTSTVFYFILNEERYSLFDHFVDVTTTTTSIFFTGWEMHKVPVTGQVFAPKAVPAGARLPRQGGGSRTDQAGSWVAVRAEGHRPPAQSGAMHCFHAWARMLREVT